MSWEGSAEHPSSADTFFLMAQGLLGTGINPFL